MNVEALTELAAEWRADASRFRRLGFEDPARMSEVHADELERRIREWQLAELTLAEAAEESGYSYSTLQQNVAAGKIPDAGKRDSPRIRRCDLPRKAPSASPDDGPDLAEEILTARMAG